MDFLPLKRAVISVTDKSGLETFAPALNALGVTLVSTGGTKKTIQTLGLPVMGVSEITGFPEILNGRVKTLHPRVHAGVLADKDDPSHMETLAELDIHPFDLVCVNLYDFAKAAARNLPLREAVEQIDIGGPTLLRASAKNYHSLLTAPGPEFYPEIMAELTAHGGVSLALRKKLAAETFARVSAYDAMIAEYLSSRDE